MLYLLYFLVHVHFPEGNNFKIGVAKVLHHFWILLTVLGKYILNLVVKMSDSYLVDSSPAKHT